MESRAEKSRTTVTGCKDKGLEKKLTFDQSTCCSSGLMFPRLCSAVYILLQGGPIYLLRPGLA